LIERLTIIQNTPAFRNVDILTITSAMSDREVEKYVRDKEQESRAFQ